MHINALLIQLALLLLPRWSQASTFAMNARREVGLVDIIWWLKLIGLFK